MSYSFKEDYESVSFIVDELIRMKVKLNDWEKDFISSVRVQLDGDKKLSDKQHEILSNMWEKY